MSYVRRLIDVRFTLAPRNGQPSKFKGTDSNTVTLKGLRVSARIVKAGGATKSTASISVYGMLKSRMDQLSTLGLQIQLVPRDTVTILAGDEDGGMFVAFEGTITQAFADMQQSPEVPFRVEAHTGLAEDVISAPPTSFKGGVDVATVMEYLAKQMNFVFENNGVSVTLSNPYFSGSYRSQALAAAQAAGIDWIIDNGILAIWPKNTSRKSKVIVVSSRTGMMSYPSYTAQGIQVSTLYNPAIQFGGKIKIESSLEQANGEWAVFTIDHNLESRVPGGRWHSTLGCYNPAFPPPVTR